MNAARLFPLLNELRHYSLRDFRADFVAALTVTPMAVPQAMAYALIAGVHPQYGIYACMLPVIVAALWGSARYLAAGPTNAISMVLFTTMSTVSIGGITVASLPEEARMPYIFGIALLCGLIQVGMGLARLGELANFISHSVMVAFSAGAALLIASGQLKTALGLPSSQAQGFFPQIDHVIHNFTHLNIWCLLVSGGTILLILLFKRISRRFPATLAALVIISAVSALLGLHEQGVRLVGAIPSVVPPLSLPPAFDMASIRDLFMPALAIALLGIPFYGHGATSVVIGIIVIAALWFYLSPSVQKKLKESWRVSARTLNTALLCTLLIVVGYSSYALIVIRSTANNDRRGEATVIAVDGSRYPLEVTQEEDLRLNEQVKVYRDEGFRGADCIGTGRVHRIEPEAVTAEGYVRSVHVQDGQTVRRGDLLFETVPDALADMQGFDGCVRMPADGVLLSIDCQSGQETAKDATLATYCERGDMQLVCAVDEEDLARIAPGQQVTVTLDALRDAPVKGTVVSIACASGEDGSSFDVIIALEDNENVRVGMNATAEL